MKAPPLHALRCFDAVARLGGVRLAAEALFVTPAAVTQQVKLLERSLGVTLLQRDGRHVSLTDAGRRLHQGTARHLKAIAQAADLVRPRPRCVRVTTVPSFAVRWLVPRLKGFTERHPGIEVQVEIVALEPGKVYELVAKLYEDPEKTVAGTISFDTSVAAQPKIEVQCMVNVFKP